MGSTSQIIVFINVLEIAINKGQILLLQRRDLNLIYTQVVGNKREERQKQKRTEARKTNAFVSGACFDLIKDM